MAHWASNGRVVFGFIHGNWALDNSRPDGKYCGLNNEITLLRDLGCYADFTMPSGASPTRAPDMKDGPPKDRGPFSKWNFTGFANQELTT